MCYNLQAQFMQVESNHEVGSAQFQVENVLADAQAEDIMKKEPRHPKIIGSAAELRDKLQEEKRSELENVYETKNSFEIPEEDLDIDSNFLTS